MNVAIASLPLLGEIGTGAAHLQQWRPSEVSGWWHVSIAVGALVLFAIVFAVLHFLRERELAIVADSTELLNELCDAHGIEAALRADLSELAKEWKLDQPAQLFLQPELWDAAELPESLEPKRAELVMLRAKLFA